MIDLDWSYVCSGHLAYNTKSVRIVGGVAFSEGTAVDSMSDTPFQSSPVDCVTVATVVKSMRCDASTARASYCGAHAAPPDYWKHELLFAFDGGAVGRCWANCSRVSWRVCSG